MDDTINPSKIYQLILIGVIGILGWTLWKELNFLFPSFLGAIALFILLEDPMAWLTKRKLMKDWLAAAILMVLTALIVVVPLWFIIKLLIVKVQPVMASPEFFVDTFNQINTYLKEQLGLEIFNQEMLQKISGKLTNFAQEILSGTFRTVLILTFMYLFLFFMMTNRRRIENAVRRNLPFQDENRRKLLNELTRMVRSNSITIPTVAFLQGSVAMIGYMIFGIKEPVLLGVLTAISSMIPVVGAMLVYLPVVIINLATGPLGPGIGLLIWCFILVGGVDNIARFLLQKKLANVHPLITILGVIVGTKLFGLIGLIFGPLTISMFVALVQVYFNEFGSLKKLKAEGQGQKAGPGPDPGAEIRKKNQDKKKNEDNTFIQDKVD